MEIWLQSVRPKTQPPDELPVLLQAMLSLDYRNQALELLDRFLSVGEWTVQHVLDVGFYSVLKKLLNPQACEAVNPVSVGTNNILF